MNIANETAMGHLGERFGSLVHGGELFELVGDVGAGKTTFTKSLARGMGITQQVQSPTFTISREYEAERGLRLVHYDFYRLEEAGIMADELAETVQDPQTVTVVEWADAVEDVLPQARITLTISPSPNDEFARTVIASASSLELQQLVREAQA